MSEQPLTAPRMVEFPLSEFHLRRALYAANRDVLWPIGLALTVSRDGDDYIRLYITEWDFGDGRVEVIEDPEPEFDAEFERFAAERRAKMSDEDRAKSLAGAAARAGVPGDACEHGFTNNSGACDDGRHRDCYGCRCDCHHGAGVPGDEGLRAAAQDALDEWDKAGIYLDPPAIARLRKALR